MDGTGHAEDSHHGKRRLSYAEAGVRRASQQRRRSSIVHTQYIRRYGALSETPTLMSQTPTMMSHTPTMMSHTPTHHESIHRLPSFNESVDTEPESLKVVSEESKHSHKSRDDTFPTPTRHTVTHDSLHRGRRTGVHQGIRACEQPFKSEFHRIMFRFVESKTFSIFILVVILLNTGILVAMTWPAVAARGSWYFSALDNIFLGIYIMEAVLKIYVWRASYFKEGWNIMDFTIVLFNILDFMLPLVMSVGGFNGAAIFRLLRIFRAIRAIRALRVLRTIRFLANLQVIVTTCLKSIQSMGAIVLLMILFLYMFAVIGRGLFATVDPDRFGHIVTAAFTMFQLLTLDDWFDIYDNASKKGRQSIIIYLLLYILLEYLIFLNLFVAVLVDNFQLALEAQNEANKKKKLNPDDSEEEDFLGGSEMSEASTVTDLSDEERPPRKTVMDYYYDHCPKDQQNLARYFQVLTALEYNTQMLHNQQKTLDLMVDMCALTEEDT